MFEKSEPLKRPGKDELKAIVEHYARRHNLVIADVQYKVDKYGAVHIKEKPK